jgi:hypothetical protein
VDALKVEFCPIIDPLPATGQGISLAFDECNGVIFCLFCCFLLMKGC